MTQTEIFIGCIIILVFGFLNQFRGIKPKKHKNVSPNEVRDKFKK